MSPFEKYGEEALLAGIYAFTKVSRMYCEQRISLECQVSSSSRLVVPPFKRATEWPVIGHSGAIMLGGIDSTVPSLSCKDSFIRCERSSRKDSRRLRRVFVVGDIEVKTMVAEGTKPIGGTVYCIVTDSECTILATGKGRHFAVFTSCRSWDEDGSVTLQLG